MKTKCVNRWTRILRMRRLILGLAAFLLLALCAQTVVAGDLAVLVTGVKNTDGKVAIAVYSSAEGFPKDASKALRKVMAPIDGATHSAKAVFAGLKPGEYEIAVFHDDNGRGKLDTNFSGIPTKGYGFSNNVRPKMLAPSFDEARFTFPAEVRSERQTTELQSLM